jgi:hypothetical protein
MVHILRKMSGKCDANCAVKVPEARMQSERPENCDIDHVYMPESAAARKSESTGGIKNRLHLCQDGESRTVTTTFDFQWRTHINVPTRNAYFRNRALGNYRVLIFVGIEHAGGDEGGEA